MSEAQWPIPFVAMYQRVLRIKQAMEQEEALTGMTYVQPEKQQDEKALPHDPLPTLEICNEDTNMLFSWDYLEKVGDWKKWADWEEWDSWNK